MKTVVIYDNVAQLHQLDWSNVTRVILANIGHPDYKQIKRDVFKITRANIFEDPTIMVVFPPIEGLRVTKTLLRGLGLLFSDSPEVICGEQIPEGL
jgi:hypothetical protein